MYMNKRMNKKKVDEEDVIMMIITRMTMKINFLEFFSSFRETYKSLVIMCTRNLGNSPTYKAPYFAMPPIESKLSIVIFKC